MPVGTLLLSASVLPVEYLQLPVGLTQDPQVPPCPLPKCAERARSAEWPAPQALRLRTATGRLGKLAVQAGPQCTSTMRATGTGSNLPVNSESESAQAKQTL